MHRRKGYSACWPKKERSKFHQHFCEVQICGYECHTALRSATGPHWALNKVNIQRRNDIANIGGARPVCTIKDTNDLPRTCSTYVLYSWYREEAERSKDILCHLCLCWRECLDLHLPDDFHFDSHPVEPSFEDSDCDENQSNKGWEDKRASQTLSLKDTKPRIGDPQLYLPRPPRGRLSL